MYYCQSMKLKGYNKKSNDRKFVYKIPLKPVCFWNRVQLAINKKTDISFVTRRPAPWKFDSCFLVSKTKTRQKQIWE